jgi:myosin heavy subunit
VLRFNVIAVRRIIARRKRLVMGREMTVLKIQSVWRGYVVRNWYRAIIRQVVLVQCRWRQRAAIREFAQLRLEAKSVGKLKENNFALENKVIQLSQNLITKEGEKKALAESVGHLETLVAHWKEKFASVDVKSKNVAGQLSEDTTALKKELAEATSARDVLVKEKEKADKLMSKRDLELSNAQEELVKVKEEMKKVLVNAPKQEDSGTIAALKKEVTSLRDQMGKLLSGKWRADRDSNEPSPAGSKTDMRSYEDSSDYGDGKVPRRASTVNSRLAGDRLSRIGRPVVDGGERLTSLNSRYSVSRASDENRRKASARASVLAESPLANGGVADAQVWLYWLIVAVYKCVEG